MSSNKKKMGKNQLSHQPQMIETKFIMVQDTEYQRLCDENKELKRHLLDIQHKEKELLETISHNIRTIDELRKENEMLREKINKLEIDNDILKNEVNNLKIWRKKIEDKDLYDRYIMAYSN